MSQHHHRSDGVSAATSVLGHWSGLASGHLEPLEGGLINLTFRVTAPGGSRYVLQRLNPIFDGSLHLDMEAVTAHLARRGVTTPRLVPTSTGDLWVEAKGMVWRLQTLLPGRTVHRVTSSAVARSAGVLLGRFHAALSDLDHDFHFVRNPHGLQMHARRLEDALAEWPHHRLYEQIAPLAEELLSMAEGQPNLSSLPRRITHGDPKISNILFLPPPDLAHALVDLDTLGRLDLPTELGDALRSWCNPAGEDSDHARLDLETFEAALDGYGAAAGSLPTAEEAELFVAGLLVVCVELACRFAADGLQERYFGWDPSRHPTRGHHNLHRARQQLELARSVVKQRARAEKIRQRILGAPG